jgi:murein DD-endopeptidase MepM/ murein hydrolase activator NlpD
MGILSGLYGSARVLNGQPRAPHLGVDVSAPEGTPIVAPTDGVVVLIADQFLTGNTVMIDHGLGLTSVYAHLSRVDVAPGEQVKAGTQIGLMGKTGRATGPNLHWGVHLNGVAVDPELLAGPMPPAAPAPSGAGGE